MLSSSEVHAILYLQALVYVPCSFNALLPIAVKIARKHDGLSETCHDPTHVSSQNYLVKDKSL